jgi:hypothetical protein
MYIYMYTHIIYIIYILYYIQIDCLGPSSIIKLYVPMSCIDIVWEIWSLEAWFMKPWWWQCHFCLAACKFWELGISFAHFCGMSTRWERRSYRWQARLGQLNPNHFFQSLVSVGALIDHNRRNVWWRVQSWDGSMVEMPSLWDACPVAICRHHSGAIGEVRGKMRRMMRRRKHLGRVSWSIGWAC